MPKCLTRTNPYESIDEVKSHFDELRANCVEELSIKHPIDSAEILTTILKCAKDAEICIAELHTRKAGFIDAVSGTSPLEELYGPADKLFFRWMPIKRIIFDCEIENASGYCEHISILDARAAWVRRIKTEYFIEFKSIIRISILRGDGLVALARSLSNLGMSAIDFHFNFPNLEFQSVESQRKELEIFCSDSVSTNPSVRFSKLPFCLLPPQSFRLVYREFCESFPDPSRFALQRQRIKEIRNFANEYHSSCKSCRRRAACYRFTPIQQHPQYIDYLEPNLEETVVLVGASLTEKDKKQVDPKRTVVATPAQQGDAVMVILEGFKNMLLIDGYFFQRYALTTFEVLTAIVENINCFGSSSLGALRGLELENYGMRVDGYVYRHLKSQFPVPYHVVAQTYTEQDEPATEALITFYKFLEDAEAAGIINSNDRDKCYAAAENLHFTQLTYEVLFQEWDKDPDVAKGTVAALTTFLSEKGKESFDVKRLDALLLLNSYQSRIERDGANFPIRMAATAKQKYVRLLRQKYFDRYDSSLPSSWKVAKKNADSSFTRERPVSETLRLAKAFFEDLDVVVSDTSLLDKTHYHMINVVFVPFYFIGWGNSAGSGYGACKEKALVAAYCEVLERIPAGSLRTNFADIDSIETEKYPFLKLPFYESMDSELHKNFIGNDGKLIDRDYVECTEVVTGKTYALPKHGARLPSSLGMASGNSILEAVVYALYEIVEHDVSATWLTSGLSTELRNVNIDVSEVRDMSFRALISDLESRGHEVYFFNLVNQYGIPSVLSIFYEADRQLIFTGMASRLGMQEAVIHSFHEALNGHYVSYFGSRDDRLGFEQKNAASPRQFLQHFLGPPKSVEFSSSLRDLSEQLNTLIEKLCDNGVEHILAINLSPQELHGLSTVKLIVPGMDRRRYVRRTSAFYRKCLNTLNLLSSRVSGVEGIQLQNPSIEYLARYFAPPTQRFFKA